MNKEIAAKYIRENYDPADRLAAVLLNKRSGAVTQRIATAEQIAAPAFQAWLRLKNAQKHEVYISMNALSPDATGRTKNDIAVVRHLYLDFDKNGTEAVEGLLSRTELPRPNYRISSSPGKWQVVWKVDGFAPERAERLQKWLARETGADPAATDSARVLRLPGFYNHKYEEPHFVTVEALHDRVYRPEDFPEPDRGPDRASENRGRGRAVPRGTLSQSERDWAFAKRALSRGESPASVITAIADRRRDEKPDPEYYAAHTVRQAATALAHEQLRVDRPEEPQR